MPARFELFRFAEARRARIPSAFVALDVFRGVDRRKWQLRAAFTHWVIEYRDKTLFHKDKQRLVELMREYAIQRSFARSSSTAARP